ncbi:phosphotransferase family protein [Mycolicibacterium iranicum]|uniref:phosphotransferase family protein n=1 Tax=Mycolicibacterium iranicum TaxID=912594 RepID=UPI000AA0DEB7|nr:phosphotransferase family protein [Mycolicibacterium iranicum]
MAGLSERLASAGITEVRPLAGGASGLTYRGVLGTVPVVVKVAPAGVEPIAHRDVLRQARILKALQRSDVPVPDVLLEDSGAPPEVPPLFVMSLCAGDAVEPLFDVDAELPTHACIGARFLNAAVAMARLHRLSPATLGVHGEAVSGPADEIERWSRTLHTVDPGLVPDWQEVRAMLASAVPPPNGPAVVHGDFRLGNLLADGEHITAVIDWEIWSVGDPRIDVGWFLVNADPHTYQRVSACAGAVPPAGELIAAYCAELGTEPTDLRWFEALACFKSAATWSLIVKHNRRRPTPDPQWEAMVPTLPRLLQRAGELVRSAG